MKKYIGFLLVFCLFIIPWYGQAQVEQEALQQQVKTWITKLSAKDQRFTPFHEAEWSYRQLDSKSTDWLVTFTSTTNREDIGYMVVGMDERTFSLYEYGLGEYTLFNEEPIVSLPSDSLGRTSHYAGLQSVWVSQEGLYDAKSGEKFPSHIPIPSPALTDFVDQHDNLTAVTHHSEPSDQTGAWIKPGKMVNTEKEFIEVIIQGGINLTYLGQLFDGSVLAPFNVLGFHQWGGVLFVELEDDGSRFVPFHHAVSLGSFFK